jgi:hypothetical protein
MCFTFLGRVETRLLSLIIPLYIAGAFALLQGTSAYWTLFGVMVVVALALDLGVYIWWIEYQAHWLTVVLGAFEFLAMRQVIGWFPELNVRLSLEQALAYYLAAWLSAWLTTQALLPILWPRWAEDGGEIRRLSL